MDELSVIRSFRAAVPTADNRQRARALSALRERIEAETTSSASRRTRPRFTRRRAMVLVVAAAAMIAIPAAAFADQISHILGLSNSGTKVAEDQLPDWQLSALQAIGFPTHGVRLLGERAGISFYVSRAGGGYCFGIGFTSARAPRIDALACGSQLGAFPSDKDPIADLSGTSVASDGHMEVTKLAGFATDEVAQVAILGATGQPVYTVPVSDNIYGADGPRDVKATAIAALDSNGTIMYRKTLAGPPTPQPAVPTRDESMKPNAP